MDTKATVLQNREVSSAFHETFDSNVRELMERVRIDLLETIESCELEEIVGQLLMGFIGDPDDGLSTDDKTRLIRVADHMGPDWAQALYRAAVFITKVA